MHKRPLAVIAVFFIIGIVLGRFLPDSVKFPHIFIVTLILILSSLLFTLTSCRPGLNLAYSVDGSIGKAANIFLLLSVTSFAALLYINSNTFPVDHISNFLGEEKLKTSIVGVIKNPALTRKPYYGKINSTYLFEVEAIKGHSAERIEHSGDGWTKVKGLGQIRIQTERDYGYGDRLMVKGTIRRPANSVIARSERSERRSNIKGKRRLLRFALNDSSGFDYGEYLARQNIFALINTKENNVTVLARDYKSNPILKYTYRLREKLKNQIIEKMPLDSGAFLRAILLGDRSELPKHIQTAFKNSGTMHILPIQNTKKLNYSS